MNPTEHTPKPSRAITGLFATLCGPLRTRGSGAPTTSRERGASRTGLRLVLSLVAAMLGVLGFAGAPALAAADHVFDTSFAGENSHALSDPSGVAVNNATGDVYVVDKGNNRVEEFNAEGTFLAEFNGVGTAGALSEPEAIAVDNSGKTPSEDPSVGDVYVTDHNVVDKFEADGTYVGQITEAEGTVFATLAGVAVNPKGVVWVYQGLGSEQAHIDAFSDARANVFLSGRESKASIEACPGLAVDSEDNLYVGHACGAIHPWFAELNSSGILITPPGNHLGGGEQKTGVAVDPADNDVFLDSVPTESGEPPEIEEFTPNGTQIEAFGAEQLSDGGGTALAVSYAPISSGDVYVVDSTAGKVDVFAPAKVAVHALSSSFTGGAGHALSEPKGVAVNDETEDVYVVDKGNKRVEEFTKDGTFIAAFAPPGGFNDPEEIAVDNSGNPLDPSAGDVYVTDQLKEGYALDKFSDTGAYEGQLRRCPEGEFAEGVLGTDERACEPAGHSTPGFTEQLTAIAVGPEGNVWLGIPNSTETFSEFSDEGAFETYRVEPGARIEGIALGAEENGDEVGYFAVREGEGLVVAYRYDFSTGALLSARFVLPNARALAVDLASGDLFVDKESIIERYAPVEVSQPSPVETFPGTGLKASQGIAVSPAGTVYATELNADDVKVFDEFPLAQVLVGATSGLGPTGVTLRGSVNPEGAKVGSCEFEYGTTMAYGQTAECEPAAGSLGEGTEAVVVSARLSGLASGTTYHYRLVASDARGANSGVDNAFTTPGPSITEEQVGFVEATAATLEAQVDPDGSQTSYHFEYDTSPYTSAAAHGTSLPIPSTAIGSGTSAVSVSVRVTGLQPGTVYYYRAVAEGAPLGAPESFYGPDATFNTNSGAEPSQSCPNAKLRAEQPYGPNLPDCRAYEMVSPLDTGGQDTVVPTAQGLRASVSGEAIAYVSAGSFAEPTGANEYNEFLSRRSNSGWSTQAITPLYEPEHTESHNAYKASVFTPELTAAVTDSTARLTNDTPKSPPAVEDEANKLYVATFAQLPSERSYQYVGEIGEDLNLVSPMGASTDLSHVVFGLGYASEWVKGTVTAVGVANNGEIVPASVGNAADAEADRPYVAPWHAVSSDGSRVYFTSPSFESDESPAQLYVRVNADQPQSEVVHPEANATGTLSEGSNVITAIAPVFADQSNADLEKGSSEVKLHNEQQGSVGPYPFAAGQSISGPGIPPGDKIVATSAESLTLSVASEATETEVHIASSRADSFAVGEQISAYGLPPGTTVTSVGMGAVTVSSASDVSAGNVALDGGGECTDSAEACTVEVSASQRSTSDTHGLQPARYWGASGDGSKVFFTSKAELTNNSYTGSEDNAPNLYEYNLETGSLTDLTGAETDAAGEGAAVQGVVQLSADGSYVYFVAAGALTGSGENSEHDRAIEGEDNLYVSHEGDKPAFVTTLASNDATDWQAEVGNAPDGGPETHTATVDPSGRRLAFISERALTGYDNEQAAAGECERQEQHVPTFTEVGACREVYLYNGQAGTLVCVSCDPTGARPTGPSNLGLSPSPLSSYRLRNFSEDGTLFFDSSDTLAPHAKDGRQNVYEYEEDHVYPLSNVAGDSESTFLDAGANGNNVFFSSADKLLPEDASQNVEVWDARVDGGYPVNVAAPACMTAEACRTASPPTPALFGAPPSATFSGPGNLVAPQPASRPKPESLTRAQKLAAAVKSCRKDKKKAERQRCEKQARNRYGSTRKRTKAKKSSSDRRASR